MNKRTSVLHKSNLFISACVFYIFNVKSQAIRPRKQNIFLWMFPQRLVKEQETMNQQFLDHGLLHGIIKLLRSINPS